MYQPYVHIFSTDISVWYFFGWMNILIAKAIFIYLAVRRGASFHHIILLTLAYTIGAGMSALVVKSITIVIVGAIIAFLLVKHFLRIHIILEDLLVIQFAISLGLGRLGCLFSGCCYGSPTKMFTGISYPQGSIPHWHHMTQGLIDPSSMSLAIHPVQLYESIAVLALGAVIYILGRKRPPYRRGLLPLFAGAYFLIRVGLESVRDGANTALGIVDAGVFSAFQWLLLCLGISMLVFAYNMIRKGEKSYTEYDKANETTLIIILVCLGILMGRNMYPIHTAQVMILMVLEGCYILKRAIDRSNLIVIPEAVTILLLVILFPAYSHLVGQQGENSEPESVIFINGSFNRTYPDELISKYVSRDADADTVDHSRGFKQSMTFSGNYHQIETCGGVEKIPYAGAAYSFKVPISGNTTGSRLIFGGRASGIFVLGDEPIGLSANSTIQLDTEYFGIGLGAGVSNYWDDDFPFLPGGYLRLGPDRLNLSAGFLDQRFPSVEPFYGHQQLILTVTMHHIVYVP